MVDRAHAALGKTKIIHKKITRRGWARTKKLSLTGVVFDIITNNGVVAHLVERSIRIAEVGSSSLPDSTKCFCCIIGGLYGALAQPN